MSQSSTILLQRATAADDAVLATLAQLDSARPIAGPALLAYVGGRAVAAASLADGRIVADPFVDTRHAVRLLQVRHATLAERPARRLPRLPRLRLRPAV
jgi:hypothetical protein